MLSSTLRNQFVVLLRIRCICNQLLWVEYLFVVCILINSTVLAKGEKGWVGDDWDMLLAPQSTSEGLLRNRDGHALFIYILYTSMKSCIVLCIYEENWNIIMIANEFFCCHVHPNGQQPEPSQICQQTSIEKKIICCYEVFEGGFGWPYMGTGHNNNKVWYVLFLL